MQVTSTLNLINQAARQSFLIIVLFILGGSLTAQTYVNGNLSTGATTQSGVAAPAGYTWSEVQNNAGVTTVSNTVSGVVSSVALNISVADDFTIPPGSSWTINKFTFYAYQTGAAASPTPFNELRLQIHDSDPSTGTSTILFGDLTTNVLTASNDALMYRVFNTTTPAPGTAPGTTRKIWTLEANVTGLTLAPGTYWIEWQTGVTTGTHFSPPSTIVGARTAPGYNALQHDIGNDVWGLLQDPGNPPALLDTVNLDMPFKIDYTASGCAGTPAPGNTLSMAATVCPGAPFTLSVTNPTSGAGITYQWQSAPAIGGPYTNIAGATSDTYTGSQTTTTFYQLVVTCSGSPGTSTPIQVGIIAPPVISSSPSSVTICSGTNTSFTATVTGGSINYQWQVSTDNGITFTDIANGGIYSGATTSTLTLTNVPFANNGYQYRLVAGVTGCSSANSAAAILTVNEAASITAQPANVTACVGNDATFTVAATGAALTYQWQVSTDGGVTFNAIPGATAATLVVPAVASGMNNNQYHVVITNSCTPAGLTSANAILTVSNVATITTSPAGTTVCEGSNATFSATASAVTYQWQVSTDGGLTFTDISGQTTTTLNLTAVTASMNGYEYRLVAFSCGAAGVNSSAATLTVNNAVTISAQPADVTSCIGAGATFTAGTDISTTTITYQWEISTDGGASYTPIPGATSASLTITTVDAGMDGDLFHVILSNGCTTALISNAALLTVASLPAITASPEDVSACENSTATFNVTATGSGLGYQWQVSTNGGTTFTDISSQNAATLTLTGITALMNNNQYQVVVSSVCSATGVTSSAATLTVNNLPTAVISAAPYSSLTTQLTTILTAAVTPATATVSWFHDGAIVQAATGTSLTVTHDDLGDYYVSVTDGNGCSNTSNTLTISDSTASNAFIYPNPGRGIFNLVFDLSTGITNKVNIGAYDSKGARVYQKQFSIITPVQTIPVDLSALSRGVYVLEITDAAGVRVRTERIIIN